MDGLAVLVILELATYAQNLLKLARNFNKTYNYHFKSVRLTRWLTELRLRTIQGLKSMVLRTTRLRSKSFSIVSHSYLRTKSLLGVKIQEKGKKTKRPRGEEGAQEKRWRLPFSP